MKLSFLAKLGLIVFAGWIVLDLIDPLDPSTVSTPFLLGIILMGLSLRQTTALVVAASILYTGLSLYALVRFHEYIVASNYHTTPHFYFSLFQRIGLFFVLSGLAIYLCYYRTESQKLLSHVQNILAKLPAPVVISDASGVIIYTNDALESNGLQNSSGLKGKRYIDCFMPDIQEGKAMRYYIELFGEAPDTVHELEISLSLDTPKQKVRLTCLGTGPKRVMITVFDRTALNSVVATR